MNIQQLKTKLENNKLDETFFIFEKTDESSDFIINQYISKISDILKLNVKYIEGINEIPDQSFIIDDNLYVIKIDSWNSELKHDNTIIVCDKCKSELKIKIPKVEDWQVIDYILNKVKGVSKQNLELLLKCYDGNYFKFMNDIDKLVIFDSSIQEQLFMEFIENDLFDTYSSTTIWDLSNNILKKNPAEIAKVLEIIDRIDVEPLGLLVVLYKNFKNIINIQTDPKCIPAKIGVTDKQFYVIKKYNCGIYSNERLIEIFEIITKAEYLFKYNELSLEDLIDYLICKICRS